MKALWIFFTLCCFLFFVIEFSGYFHVNLPRWTRHYLKDFLCMPVVLGICLIIAQWLKQDKELKLGLLIILCLSTFYSIYFEFLLPLFVARYTADFLDLLMYFTGATFFYLLQYIGKGKKKAALK
ncbi:hypothetical protein [Christiangramia sp.]|uniref:hypothetical protein n=1 Tax=Christiangramia sp. TaxID=1931228 RepID=UPI00261E56CB|nr:hypothetical protein [Christiangramia sp.]